MKTDLVLTPVPYSFYFLLLALLLRLNCPTLHRLLTNFGLQPQTPQNQDPNREVVGCKVKVDLLVVGQYQQRIQISSAFWADKHVLGSGDTDLGKEKKTGKI